MSRKQLGIITQGSLSSGLEMLLHADQSVEDIRVGKFVVVEGQRNRFFSMLTDVSLGNSNPKILLDPPSDPYTTEVLSGIGTFGTVKVQPMLMLEKVGVRRPASGVRDKDSPAQSSFPGTRSREIFPGVPSGEIILSSQSAAEELRPVKTIPSHFAPVFEATEKDFQIVFGREDDPERPRFSVGSPLDMDTPVCLDLERFVERCNGIFGKAGTGKSFLTRLLLCGTIQKGAAVNLVFDMHNEYGWQARSENRGEVVVKGLKQLFGSQVAIFTLDADSTRTRGLSDFYEVQIGLDQIQIEDLALLKDELNLSEASIESAMILREELGERQWLHHFLAMSGGDIDAFVEARKGHSGALKALQRKLTKVTNLKYIRDVANFDAIDAIVRHLDSGHNVVLEFGRENNLLSYMLATNIITRRIHSRYVGLAELYNADPHHNLPPRQLMITIEEAHKFLAPAIAHQTIFGTIAREMRKYFVTLLIVDQRPSGIDSEIMSQVGTRITALLNDERDIDAIFTGVSGGNNLKVVLSQLDPKQQALILGYAVPMPVVVRCRSYDRTFYQSLGRVDLSREDVIRRGQENIAELFPG